jgi:hypothetical protein
MFDSDEAKMAMDEEAAKKAAKKAAERVTKKKDKEVK